MKTNPTLVRKTLGVISILFGVVWCGAVIYSPLRQLLSNPHREVIDYFLICTIVPLMVLPGVLALGEGIRLYRAVDEGALKCVVGTFAVLGALGISRVLAWAFPHRLAEQTQMWLYLLLGALVVIPIYLIAVRQLLEILGQAKPKLTSLLGKGVLALIAWLLWLLLSNAFHDYAPLEEGRKSLHKAPWETLSLLVPLIVAYGGYKLAAALLLPARPKRSVCPAPPCHHI